MNEEIFNKNLALYCNATRMKSIISSCIEQASNSMFAIDRKKYRAVIEKLENADKLIRESIDEFHTLYHSLD